MKIRRMMEYEIRKSELVTSLMGCYTGIVVKERFLSAEKEKKKRKKKLPKANHDPLKHYSRTFKHRQVQKWRRELDIQ